MPFTVTDLPQAQRPRERLANLGAEAVSEQELLCCLLGRGIAGESVMITSQRLLKQFGGLRGIADASVDELAQVRGVGPAKSVQLKAAAEFARRVAIQPQLKPLVDTAEAAAAIVRPLLADKQREHFVALLLDARRRLIRTATISVGSLTASLVHPRELFREAIVSLAAGVIVAHNHPSGDAEPSDNDLVLTRQLTQAGRLLGIELLDHLIVGAHDVVSLRARGAFGQR